MPRPFLTYPPIVNPGLFNRSLIEHLSSFFPLGSPKSLPLMAKPCQVVTRFQKGMDHALNTGAADAGMTLAQDYVREIQGDYRHLQATQSPGSQKGDTLERRSARNILKDEPGEKGIPPAKGLRALMNPTCHERLPSLAG